MSRTGMLDIYAYDFRSGSRNWRTLPCNNVMVFGMCMFRDRLMTVGGGTSEGLTDKVYSLDPSAATNMQEWEEFEPMACARMALSAVSSSNFIVALGGAVWVVGKKDPTPINTVEVYHASTKQWQQVSDIPYPCASMSTTVMNNVCYLMGDINTEERRKVLCVDLLQFSLPVTPPEGSFVSIDLPSRHSSSSASESCSSPSLILSPYPSPMHEAHPANMAAAAAAAIESNDAFVDVSDCNGGNEFQSQGSNQVPHITITSPQRLHHQQPFLLSIHTDDHHQAMNSAKASDSVTSTTTPISSSDKDAKVPTPIVRLSHSPVNAVPSHALKNCIPPSSPRTPSPLPSSSSSSSTSHMIFSSSSSSSSSTHLVHQPHVEEMYSKSMPNLDKMPRVKTLYYFYPRASGHSHWFTVPPPPTVNGCVLGINDHLLSFGGIHNGSVCKTMFLYSAQTNQWMKVVGGDIPCALEGSSCSLLKSGEIILVGGEDSNEEYSSRVYIGSSAK